MTLPFPSLYRRAPDGALAMLAQDEYAALAAGGAMPPHEMVNGLPVLLSEAEQAALVPPLAQRRALALAAAGRAYQTRLAAGVAFAGKTWQIDEASQARIAAMASAAVAVLSGVPGASWPAGFAFIAADNSAAAMTAQQMFDLSSAARDRVIALRVAFRALKDAILAADAPEAIDVAAGWPE